MTDSITIAVDAVPLSLNNLYPTGSHGKRFKTPKAKELLQLIALQTRGFQMQGTAFSMSLWIQFADNRRHDTSNYCKHPEDCLVELGVIPDDDLITEHVLRKSYGDKPLTQITVTKLA